MKEFSEYPLLEREGEIAATEAAMARAAERGGLCLVFEGAAGVGKTRLLEAARSAAQAEGFRVLRARAGEREREYAWGVVRALFEPVLLAADERELGSLLAGGAGICRPLLEAEPLPTEGTPDSSFAVFSGFQTLTQRLADDQPLLIAVDDLHWVDGPSLGFLEFLARRLEGRPIVVATTLRPNEPGTDAALIASLLTDPLCRRLHPQPLSARGSAAALRRRLGDAADDAVAGEAHAATGGNPLLLNELARTLEIEAESNPAAVLPGTVAELGSKAIARSVAVRTTRAGIDGRRLAAAAAVLGEGAHLGQAIELASLDQAAADRAALDLVRLEILLPGSRVGFVHPVVRAAVYDALPAPERVRLHRRAAAILTAAAEPPERLAGHLLEVDPSGDPETVAVLRAAAIQAASGGDSRSATVLMRRALAEPPRPEERTDVLSQLGAAELLVDGPAAVAHLEQALTEIDEPAYRASITELLARAMIFQERVTDAVEVCDRSRRALEGLADPPSLRRLEAVLVEATVIEPAAIDERHTERAARLLAEASRNADDDYGSRALLGLSAIAGARDLSMTAGEASERAVAAARGGVLIREGMNSIAQLAPSQALTMAGRYAEGIALLEESLRWDERYGSVFGHLSNLIFRGRARLWAGSLEGAVADTTESLRLSKAYGITPGVSWSAAILAEALLERGDPEAAGAVMAVEVAADEPAPWGWHWMSFTLTRARLLLAGGAPERALAEATKAGELYAANRGVGSTWLSWRPVAAQAALALDDRDGAAALAHDELTLARQWGAPRQIGRALRAAAAAASSLEEREALLVEAIAMLDTSEARLELAEALVDHGACTRRANRKSESRDALRRGMDLAHDCGADQLANRARTELRASGVRARRTALSGPDALTASERRVVDLAVDGLSNKEIAAELVVTVKTVEVHLSNSYRKLEVKGRRELAAVMQPETEIEVAAGRR